MPHRPHREPYEFVDYIDDEDPQPAASTGTPPGPQAAEADLELNTETNADAATSSDVDPFLLELLPEDRNARRRVVTALLRAVLTERKIT